MARQKNNKQGKWSQESMKEAILFAKNGSVSVRKAARKFGVPRSTLERRIKGTVRENQPASRSPVFTADEESNLVGYILEMANCGFGLSIKNICEIAFEMSVKLNKINSFNKVKREAGYQWYSGFMRRHPQLSLRKPEGLSSVRANMLNKNVVSAYFRMLADELQLLDIVDQPTVIYNVDETGISTVHQPGKIVGLKGKKSIHSKISADRGENVTAVVCVSASGHYIPPMVIFKGQRLNQGLVSNAPPGTLFATSKSSFIDRELFGNWFNHFIKHLPTARPVMLILDGHASHIGLETLLLAKDNGITIMCLPPHTTSELQPLDKCFFKPLKTEYSKVCVRFLKENPGRVVTRYDFCNLFKLAYLKVCTISTAMSAFKATGICPLNPSIISEDVFLPSTIMQIRNPQPQIIDGSEEVAIPSTSGMQPHLEDSHHVTEAGDAPLSCSNTDVTITTLFQVPRAYKDKGVQRKSQKVLTARCLTESEFIRQLEEKEKENQAKLLEKENRQKQSLREQRKTEKLEMQQQKKGKLVKKSAVANSKPNKNIEPVNNEENYCEYCKGYYYDDDSDGEDWVKCTAISCNSWYHESCTGALGRLHAFRCTKHD